MPDYISGKILRQLLFTCVMIFASSLLSACGGAAKIETPLDGSFITDSTPPIRISLPDDTPSKLQVLLNGADITGHLEISNKTAQGDSPELLNGINVLKVVWDNKSTTFRFAYFSGSVPENLIPLYSKKSYLELVEKKYDLSQHNKILSLMTANGYSDNIVTPFEVTDEHESFLITFLQESDTPSSKIVGVANYKYSDSRIGTITQTYGFELIGPCTVQIFDENNSETVDACQSSQNLGSSMSQNQPTGGALDWLVNPSRSSALGCMALSICGGSFLKFLGSFVATVGCPFITGGLGAAGCYVVTVPTLIIFSDDFAGCAVENCVQDLCASCGDPHIAALDGVHFDNQLIGEFVLVRDKTSSDFEIQARQEEVFSRKCVTGNSVVALKIGNDLIEYRAINDQLLIGGSSTILEKGSALSLDGGTVYAVNEGFRIIDTKGNRITLIDRGDYINVKLGLASLMNNKVEGLLGNFDGNRRNDTILRSGEINWDLDKFNEDWRIMPEESLFSYGADESTATYTQYNACHLTPAVGDYSKASQIFSDHCGFAPEPNNAFVEAAALDIAAGMNTNDIPDWFENICENGKQKDSAIAWPELIMIVSTFETSAEGWTISGDNEFVWENIGGEHGGVISIQDDSVGDWNRASAPPRYLGDWSHFSSEDEISYDVQYSPTDGATFEPPDYQFEIVGQNGYARASVSLPPETTEWTTLSIKMDPNNWVVVGSWEDILSNVQGLKLLAEVYVGKETFRIDNIKLTNTPNKIN